MMTLYYPTLSKPLYFEENKVNVLAVENPAELRYVISELTCQTGGGEGNFVLGINNEIADLGRLGEIVANPFDLEFESRKLEGCINREAAEAAEDFEDEFRDLTTKLNVLASKVTVKMSTDVTYTELDGPEKLLKLMGFHVDSDALDLPERMLEYMLLRRRFFGKELFVIYGLKALLTREESELFYRSAFYAKINLLMLESAHREDNLPCEKVTIVDKDLCIID